MSATPEAITPPVPLAVTVYTKAPAVESGVYALAALDVPQLGLTNASVVLDLPRNRLMLVLPCGCHVAVSLHLMLKRLQQVQVQAEQEEAGHACAAAPGVH